MKIQVDRALESCGIPLPDHPFRPHLTLGRVRALKDLGLFHSTIGKMKDRFSGSVLLEKLILYRSELGSGKRVYTPLEQFDFDS